MRNALFVLMLLGGKWNSPEIELVRYMVFDKAAMPKRRARGVSVVSRDDGLRIHPQPARGEIRFGIEAEGDGTATLLDLLGRRVIELPLAGDGATIRGVMGLESVRPGLYMLVVRTADRVRTGKVIVTR
ncbi:MAG TPA: T9SS type A sorting domain-containing protein [Bacteroidota bacterium]|nr:T9SS type A sorting domain-containing protein [Bacteroidota bacterium]